MKVPAYVELGELADRAVAKRSSDRAALTPVNDDGVILLQASTLTPEPVDWLWRHWLALGKFHVLAGPPGQGKTTIALACAATISAGGRWPDGSRCAAGNVLMWSGEDDPADTLLPRLLAMGADVSRIYFINGTRIAGKAEPFDPARDLVQLSQQAEAIGDVRLLIVDPVVSAVASDSHKNGEVRRALQPLVELASTLDAAVLGISHFSKGSAGRDPVERVTGSLAFGALARVVLCAVKVQGNEPADDHRILARAKSNIGPDDGGFEYRIEQTELTEHLGISASVILWGQPVAGTARELLADAEANPQGDDESSAHDDAMDFLRSELKDGPKAAKAIFIEARGAGHSERTIKRAKARLHVESLKERDRWVWALPAIEAKGDKGAKTATSQTLGTLGTLGTIEAEGEVFYGRT
jgi:putative DNA primase/helicase